MKLLNLVLIFLSLNCFAELKPLNDEQLREQNGDALPPWISENEILTSSVQNTKDLLALLDFAKAMKDSVEAGIPEELNIAINNQRFLDEIVDPNQKLHILGQILKTVFEGLGVNFQLSFDNVQTRGHLTMIFVDGNGQEISRAQLVDYVGRISVENIRIGNGKPIGNIYFTDIDYAPGSIMRVHVRE